MIKNATVIRSGTASTEVILRRITKANAIHPTYQAMIELGRAQKTLSARGICAIKEPACATQRTETCLVCRW